MQKIGRNKGFIGAMIFGLSVMAQAEDYAIIDEKVCIRPKEKKICQVLEAWGGRLMCTHNCTPIDDIERDPPPPQEIKRW